MVVAFSLIEGQCSARGCGIQHPKMLDDSGPCGSLTGETAGSCKLDMRPNEAV